MQILLALVTVACALVTPALLFGGLLALVAGRLVRGRPTWRTRLTVIAALLAAPAAAALEAVLVVVAFFEGTGEGAEALPIFVLGAATVGGALALVSGAALAWGRTGHVLSPPRPRPDDARTRRGPWLLGTAVAALLAGGATSLVGLALSLSLGVLSLAFAAVLVRPLALAFCVLHAALALACVMTARREERPGLAIAGAAVHLVGVVLAVAIAAFAPGLFESGMGHAFDFMLV